MTKHASLAYQDAKSDKVYIVDLEPSGDGFTVTAQYGRRGGTLAQDDKTKNGPIDFPAAEKIFDRVVREKLAKGYQLAAGSAPAPQVAPDAAPFVALMPELLDEISAPECARLILSPDYYMQDKSDGHSRGIVKRAGKISGINKTGQPVPLPKELHAELEQIALSSFQLDAELIGSRLVCRDLLAADGDISASPYSERFALLVAILYRPIPFSLISIVNTWKGAKHKAAAMEEQQARNREGVVFKDISAPYRPGRSGQHKKYKFTKTLSAIAGRPGVTGKNSVQIFLYEGAELIRCGTVSLNGKATVKEGDILEVIYLYAFPSKLISQARLSHVRDDVTAQECTTSQLIFRETAPHSFETFEGEDAEKQGVWCKHCNTTRDEIPGMHPETARTPRRKAKL